MIEPEAHKNDCCMLIFGQQQVSSPHAKLDNIYKGSGSYEVKSRKVT